MADKSGITWTDATWNVVTGCTPCAEECRNCWAKQLHDMRHKAYLAGKKMPEQYADPFALVTLHPNRVDVPLHWKRPRKIFPCSTGDLFHPNVPDSFLDRVFKVMQTAKQHQYQVLTKRALRMRDYLRGSVPVPWGGFEFGKDAGKNIWCGITVGTRGRVPEIDVLRQTPASVRWLSIEPLLEDLGTINLEGIHWVVVGCESGKNARPCDINWIRSLRDQCAAANVAFYLKQMVVNGKVETKPYLDGRKWIDFPK